MENVKGNFNMVACTLKKTQNGGMKIKPTTMLVTLVKHHQR
jgi:hypothetical protein